MTVLNIETQLGINKKDQIFEGPARIINTEGFEFDGYNDLFKSSNYAQSLSSYYYENNSTQSRKYYLTDASNKGNIAWSKYENAWEIYTSDNKYANVNETNSYWPFVSGVNAGPYHVHENYESPSTEYNNNIIQGETYRLNYYQDSDGYHDICITYYLAKESILDLRVSPYFKNCQSIQIRDKEQNNKLICSLSMNDTNMGIVLAATNQYFLSIKSNNYIYINKITLTGDVPTIESKRVYDTLSIDYSAVSTACTALSFDGDKLCTVMKYGSSTGVVYLTGLNTSFSSAPVTGFTFGRAPETLSCMFDITNTYVQVLFKTNVYDLYYMLIQFGTSNYREKVFGTTNSDSSAYFPVHQAIGGNQYVSKFFVRGIYNSSTLNYTHTCITKIISTGSISVDPTFQTDLQYAVPGIPVGRPAQYTDDYAGLSAQYLYFLTTNADATAAIKETTLFKYIDNNDWITTGSLASRRVSYVGRIHLSTGIIANITGWQANYLLTDLLITKYSKDITINATTLKEPIPYARVLQGKYNPQYVSAYSVFKRIDDFDISSYVSNGSNPLFVQAGKAYNPISLAPSLTVATAITGSGGPGAGTYTYLCIIETDTPWGIVQSFPNLTTLGSQVTLTSSQVAQVTLQNLNLHVPYGNHYMAVYRTTNGGSVYRLCGRKRLQSFYNGVDYGYGYSYPLSQQYFYDTNGITDYYLLQNKALYTTGSGSSLDGRMANYGVPAHTVIKEAKDRWIACGLENRKTVQFSLLKQPNEPVQFAHPSETSLLIEMPSEAVSVNYIDDTYLVFCSDGVYSIYGQGPDDTGSNGYFDYPQKIFTIGTSNKRTCDCNIGVVYQGKDNKLYLVQKGSGNQVIPISVMLQNDLGIVADFYYDVNRNQLKVLEQDANKVYTYSFEKNVWTSTVIDFSGLTGFFKCTKFIEPTDPTDRPRILVRTSQFEDFSLAGFSTFVMYQKDIDTIKQSSYKFTTNRFCPAVQGSQMGPARNSQIGTYGELSSIKLNILKKNNNIQTTNRQVKLSINYFDGDSELTETKIFNLRADVSTYNNYEELVYKPAFKKIKNIQLVVEFLFNAVTGYDANLIGITIEGVSQGLPNKVSQDQRG
jgi:hypothetical protein